MVLEEIDDAVAAEAFRRLVKHLRHRSDAANIDLMGLAGFCRNCLADWVAEAGGIEKDKARTAIYGMPYDRWKALNPSEATPEQIARMEQSVALNRSEEALDDALDDSFPASDPPAITEPNR